MRRSWVGVASELGLGALFGFRKGRKIFFKKCVCNPRYTTTIILHRTHIAHTQHIPHTHRTHIKHQTLNITHHTNDHAIPTCPYAKLLTPSFNRYRLSSKHDKEFYEYHTYQFYFPLLKSFSYNV